MKNLNQAQRVKYAVLNAPYLIPKYYKPPYNKTLTKGILRKMVNRSVGIEIECYGSLSYFFLTKDQLNPWSDTADTYKDIKQYYNITNYSEDQSGNAEVMKEYALNLRQRGGRISDEDRGFNEHKIRISDHKQLIGLYEILNDMKIYCRLNHGSGIHLHIDISKEFHSIKEWQLANLITSRINEIEKIFYPNSNYDATYNTDKRCGTSKGHNWVAIRSYKTVEFRIAPMTFEYSEIVRWIIECEKIVNWALNNLGNNRSYRINKNKAKVNLELTNQENEMLNQIIKDTEYAINTWGNDSFTTIGKETLKQIVTFLKRKKNKRRDLMEIIETNIEWYSVNDPNSRQHNSIKDILNYLNITSIH